LKEKKKEQEDVEEIPLEEILEEQRAKLTTRTPLTLENFLKWKEEKKRKKEEKQKESRSQREIDLKSGKAMRSGREVFEFNPDLFIDEEDVMETEQFESETQDEGPIIKIEVTPTSIRTTITNNNSEENDQKSNGKEEGVIVEESLFVDELEEDLEYVE